MWYALAAAFGIEGVWLGILAVRVAQLAVEVEGLAQRTISLQERQEQ
jgi:hypothetical protein